MDLAPLLRLRLLRELTGLCAVWPPIQSVSRCMLNSPWHLGLLSSVPLSTMCGGGGKRGETWEDVEVL